MAIFGAKNTLLREKAKYFNGVMSALDSFQFYYESRADMTP